MSILRRLRQRITQQNRKSPRQQNKPREETPHREIGEKQQENICSNTCSAASLEQDVKQGGTQDGTAETLNAERVGGTENGVFTERAFGCLYELIARFPDECVAEDVASEPFRLFAAGKRGDVAEVYADYLAFRKATGKADSTQSKTNAPERTQANSFSAFGGSALPDYGRALSARQMQIAKESGMSYREYAELLEAVPTHRAKTL